MKHIVTDNTISIFLDGQVHIFNRSDLISIKILDCLNKKEYENLPKLMDLAYKIKELGGGLFEIKNDGVYINGAKASADMQEQIINMAKIS